MSDPTTTTDAPPFPCESADYLMSLSQDNKVAFTCFIAGWVRSCAEHNRPVNFETALQGFRDSYKDPLTNHPS